MSQRTEKVVEALYGTPDFGTEQPGRLPFVKGELIAVLSEDASEDGVWWMGELISDGESRKGVFPRYFVEPAEHQGVALHDCEADEPGELSFKKGDRLVILATHSEHEDWWTGALVDSDCAGTFPSNYVSIVHPEKEDESESNIKPKLPVGWRSHIDKTTGRRYYHNSKSGVSSWHPPTPPDPPATSDEGEALTSRPGWTRCLDKASGLCFYFHVESRLTQWEVPGDDSNNVDKNEAAPPPTTDDDADDDDDDDDGEEGECTSTTETSNKILSKQDTKKDKNKNHDADNKIPTNKKEEKTQCPMAAVPLEMNGQKKEEQAGEHEIDELSKDLEAKAAAENEGRITTASQEATAQQLAEAQRELEALRASQFDAEKYRAEVEALRSELELANKKEHHNDVDHHEDEDWPEDSDDDEDEDDWRRRGADQASSWDQFDTDGGIELWLGAVVLSSRQEDDVENRQTNGNVSAGEESKGSFRRKKAAVNAYLEKSTLGQNNEEKNGPTAMTVKTIAARKQYRIIMRMRNRMLVLAWERWRARLAILRYAQDTLLLHVNNELLAELPENAADLASAWVLNLTKPTFEARIHLLRRILHATTPPGRFVCIDPPANPHVLVTTPDHRIQYHPLPSSCILADLLNLPAEALSKYLQKNDASNASSSGKKKAQLPIGFISVSDDPSDHPELCVGFGTPAPKPTTWWFLADEPSDSDTLKTEGSLPTGKHVDQELHEYLGLDDDLTIQCGIVTVRCLDTGTSHAVHVSSSGGLVVTKT